MVVVRLARYDSAAASAAHVQRLQQSRVWRDELQPDLRRRLAGPPQRLRLQPTRRSRLR